MLGAPSQLTRLAAAASHVLDRTALRLHHPNPNDERGASMAEYGLLLVLVLIVAFISLQVFGETIVGVFDVGATTMEEAVPNEGG